jgi:hypothetical protein
LATRYQSATFRPRGIWGKLYWYSVLPFHGFIFNGMLNKLILFLELCPAIRYIFPFKRKKKGCRYYLG